MEWQGEKLILASASPIRRQLLEAAGLMPEVVAANVDEQAIRAGFERGEQLPYAQLARRLAAAKARDVSQRHPAAWVVGADQVLFVGSRLFVKPESAAQARADLQALRGRWHTLASAVAVAMDGKLVWDGIDTARLQMRAFSNDFLDSFIAKSGRGISTSVGGYQLEGLGVHLFQRLEGDYFTILGLPLLPLLAFFRGRACLAA
jgi:septum formation protein